jgi:hypothetical protein
VLRAALAGTAANSSQRRRLLESARLPGVLLPGQSGTAAMLLRVPGPPGEYRIEVTIDTDGEGSNFVNRAISASSPWPSAPHLDEIGNQEPSLCTANGTAGRSPDAGAELPMRACALTLQVLTTPDPYQIALADGARMAQLPVGYREVSAGRLAWLKRWIKTRLLGGFQRGYVDVLSRQQSAMNRHLITAIAELGILTERLAAAKVHQTAEPSPGSMPDIEQITAQLSDVRASIREMNSRLAELETTRVREEP